MAHPPLGMNYEDVRKRVKRIHKKRGQKARNLENSLINQSRLCDGEGAATELDSELNHARTNYATQYKKGQYEKIFKKEEKG